MNEIEAEAQRKLIRNSNKVAAAFSLIIAAFCLSFVVLPAELADVADYICQSVYLNCSVSFSKIDLSSVPVAQFNYLQATYWFRVLLPPMSVLTFLLYAAYDAINLRRILFNRLKRSQGIA